MTVRELIARALADVLCPERTRSLHVEIPQHHRARLYRVFRSLASTIKFSTNTPVIVALSPLLRPLPLLLPRPAHGCTLSVCFAKKRRSSSSLAFGHRRWFAEPLISVHLFRSAQFGSSSFARPNRSH